MKRPTRVTRGSFLVTTLVASGSAMFVVHRAELEDVDELVVEAVALLPEQHRAAAVELDRERDQRHDRQRQQQDRKAPTTWSNSHFITTSQSVIGSSNTSSTGTLPR